MRQRATLRLDSGTELRVEIVHDDGEEIVLRRATDDRARDLLSAIDAHLATATPHPAGTTDRLLAADRRRRA